MGIVSATQQVEDMSIVSAAAHNSKYSPAWDLTAQHPARPPANMHNQHKAFIRQISN